jgi:hypothetical protein
MFKELVNSLILQGWRVYYLKDLPPALERHLDLVGKRQLLEFRVYHGKSLLFVRSIQPKREKDKNNIGSNG